MGQTFLEIKEHYKGLKADFPKLSDYEALSLAAEFQRNEILIAGFNVHYNNKHPSSLEAIAIQLGQNPIR